MKGACRCPDCGHKVREGFPCPRCEPVDAAPGPWEDTAAWDDTTAWERERMEERTSSTLCTQCGNVVPQGAACPVCVARYRALTEPEADAREPALQLCPGCGNDVEDIRRCPICADGRSTGTKVPKHDPLCPRCDQPLERQAWDDVEVLACPGCQGVLFPPFGLRRTLRRLREEAYADHAALTEARKKNLRAALPDTVRYKSCPVCRHTMIRRNFANLSGIILDVCGAHGTWVDSAVFEQLAALASRGIGA